MSSAISTGGRAARAMRVLVDASAFVALYYPQDPHAETALRVSRELAQAHGELYTSNYVFAEVLTVLSQRVRKAVALSFREKLRDGEVTVTRVTEDMEDEAFAVFAKTQKDVSYVDCTCIVWCARLGITTIFSFDRHFSRCGLQLLGGVQQGSGA